MIEEDYKTVIAARKKKGSKFSHNARNKYVADTTLQISENSSTLTEIKAFIVAFSAKPQGTNSSESNIGQEAPVSGYAGNSFGGRASRRAKI